tara:strand:- start:665 stop:790 length:126 start_codon:yes stop_codon:yes gene_type:complete
MQYESISNHFISSKFKPNKASKSKKRIEIDLGHGLYKYEEE